MRIVVAGSGRLAVSVMEPLLAAGHTVSALVQNGRKTPAEKRAWFRMQRWLMPPALDAASLALRRRIPLLWLDRMDEAEVEVIRRFEPDLILTAGFSIIFNEALLDLPAIGCVNVHSSLLPAHRGASPFAHVILADEARTGVTFHAMTPDIDDGAILAQDGFAITSMDTSVTVYYRCCDLAREMVIDLVDEIALHGLSGRPQDPSRASYDPRVTETTTAIDWRDSAEYIERLVRASLAYFPAWFVHRGRKVRVTRATYDPRPVDAGPGTVLETRPYPVVATGQGRLIIHAAHHDRPVPLSWPGVWSRPHRAEVLTAAASPPT